MAVYFIQAGEDGPVKIGVAKNPEKRLPALQVNCVAKLRPLGVVNGDRETERSLHARFAASRVRGEWFGLSAELQEFTRHLLPFPPRRPVFVPPVGRQWTIDELITAAGGVSRLAEIAGVDHSSVSASWRRTGRVPVERALRISEALQIPLSKIRPDVWRPDGVAA